MPVGLLGEISTIARVRGVTSRSASSGSGTMPSASARQASATWRMPCMVNHMS